MRPAAAALAAAAAVAAVVGAASLIGPPESVVEEHPGADQPVVRSALVCPDVGGELAGTSAIGVLALPGVEDGAADGADGAAEDAAPTPATVTALAQMPEPDPEATTPAPTPPPPAEAIASAPERGVPLYSDIDTDDPAAYAVEADGPLASGLAAEQSLLAESSDLHGLSTTPCTTAAREHWFVGGSGEVGRRGRLILANPTDVPAVVDVTLWDEAGPIDAPATQDIAVAARSQRVLRLDALAPESARVGVQVTTSQGRVSAALEVRETAEITPQGLTYIPAATTPSTEVVVPGVPGAGERLLRILAPGDTDAIVSMRLLGPQGPFAPVDQEVTTVPAGSVLEVPLDSGVEPVAVELTSDEPITAAVRVVQTAEDELPDVAYTAAAPALAGPAATLLGNVTEGVTTTLVLSAVTEAGGRAVVRTFAADGSAATETPVDVPAGASVAVPLAVPEGAAWITADVVPDAPGTLVAARVMAGAVDSGAVLDLMPLISPAVEVNVPDVVGELPEVPDPEATG